MDDVELIKQKINIVDLLSEYLPLKKAGINFKALCPFHSERTPSFMVSPERGIWHCFGCNLGGDIFKFLMEKEGLSFSESLDVLAKKAGVVLKRVKKTTNTTDRLYQIHQKAQQFFHFLLIEHPLGKKALDYFKERGVKDETIKAFGLGYAPFSWESLIKFLKKRGFSSEEIITSGLGVPSQRDLSAGRQGCYDRFRGRIIFPLYDSQERLIGFSGRIIERGEPKYINSPQTPIFERSKFLFGLNLSKGAIREKNEVILVEGEMDMILSFQEGVKNIVASKGTALTEEQVETLKKFAGTISLCFDTDFAGDVAARRGIEIADRAGLNIKVIKIEGGKDPAELCLKDPKLWQIATTEAMPIYDYYLKSASVRFNPKEAVGKKGIFAELLPILRSISDSVTKEHYIQKLSSLIQVKDEIVRKEIDKKEAPSQKVISDILDRGKDNKIEIKDRRKLLEEYLLALILHIPRDITYIPGFPETLFTQESLKQAYVLLVIYLDSIAFKGKSFKINEFISSVPGELVSTVDRLYLMEIDDKIFVSKNWQKELDLVVSELKRMLIKSSLEKLSLQMKNAQDFDNLESLDILNKRFRDLSIKLKNL